MPAAAQPQERKRTSFGGMYFISELCGKTGRALAQKLTEGEDFYFNEQGLMVLTAKYLQKRGYCCRNACRHCPYGFRKEVAAKQKKV